MPDLRPSSPFSSGPTLFLAPSPIAWQARHLLNEVLPAAASCASAPDAAAMAAMTIRALKVGFFMGCSSSFAEEVRTACGTAGLAWTSHETLTGFRTCGACSRETASRASIGLTDGLPKRAPDVLDLPRQIDNARGPEETHGHHDAGFRSGGSGSPRRHRGRLARDRAGRGRDRQRGRDDPLRVRRADGLSPAADGRGAARYHRAGLAEF